MIPIYIQGKKDGEYEIDLTVPVTNIENIFSEFFGNIRIIGIMRKLGNRYSIKLKAYCQASLVCDISLSNYDEMIETEIKCSYLANNELYWKRHQLVDIEEEKIIHEDSKYIDISNEIREQLAVNLPLKRVAPDYRDKNIEDIYPEYTQECNSEGEIDLRWEPLKKIKFN